jgi:glycerate kinase
VSGNGNEEQGGSGKRGRREKQQEKQQEKRGGYDVKKIVLIPDSFKGTMSSMEICTIMKETVLSHFPECGVLSIPVADGGEGSVDCFLNAVGGEKLSVRAAGPFFGEMDTFYGIVDGGKTAVVEMAACAGLPLAGENRNPMMTTSFGVGQIITSALERGCRKIILGLGGSSTNDAGCGAAAALGAKFLDKNGTEFIPVGGTLREIALIDLSGLHPALPEAELICMCDIDNPLYGENGAAFVFAPQKGADADMVRLLDEGLRHFAGMARGCLGKEVGTLPGGGAAGGDGCRYEGPAGCEIEAGHRGGSGHGLL